MATYYRLLRDNEANLKGLRIPRIDDGPDLDVSWSLGTKIKARIPTPIRCTLDPASGTDMPDAFFWKIPLFSDRLVEVLTTAGVDNLDTYDAEVVNPKSRQVRADYKATNVVGKVECVDMKKSAFDERSQFPLIEFSKVVINPKKVGRAKMFRLAENPRFLIVSEQVKKALDGQEWVGLSVISLDDDAAY